MTIDADDDRGTVTDSGGAPSDAELDGTALVGTDDDALTTSDVFDVLKNERRRAVIDHLNEADGTADLSDIAERIAARENETTVQRLTSQERKRVRIALYQCHLPRMDELGVVEFDKNRGTVALGPQASRVRRYMNTDPPPEPQREPSGRVEFAFAAGVAALVTVGAVGVGPLSAAPPAAWTALCALALVALAGRQWRLG